jgi:hypothetical protein
VVIAVLANADTELPGEIFREIMPVLYGEGARDTSAARPPVANAPPVPFRAVPDLAGLWSGHIRTYQGNVPLTLAVTPEGDVRARVGTDPDTLVNDFRLDGNLFTGRLTGSVGTRDAARLPYDLRLNLRLREGGVLNGSVTARSLPGKRLGNALSHWTELKRTVAQQPLPPSQEVGRTAGLLPHQRLGVIHCLDKDCLRRGIVRTGQRRRHVPHEPTPFCPLHGALPELLPKLLFRHLQQV